MLGGLFDLSLKQKSMLHFIQLSPTIISFISLAYIQDALLSIIAIQIISFIMLPIYYIKSLSKEKEIEPYFHNEFSNRHY